jgi:glycosyltransferase involved in cell wall biosynthesis
MPDLTILVPVFNEEESVIPLLDEIISVVGEDPAKVEILFVNDGSSDRTEALLKEARRRCPALRVITLAQNAGQSSAMACGFRRAQGRYIVVLDGDGQNDPADVPRIVELLDQFEVVCGIRRNRRDTWSRRWASKFANWAHQKLLGDTIVDIGCSLKGFHREPLQDLYFFKGVHRFLPILLERNGCSVKQIEVNHRPRQRGKSKYSNLGRALVTWQDVLAVRWMLKRKLNYQIKES